MHTELNKFMKILKDNKENLTRQQYKTVRGQALSGNLEGARKGLAKLLKRRCG
ncbi:MAG: hypothetical protein PHN80_13335 [Hespellia sp.]|nr:hypothetical protein [Hespellia sp.]